MGNDIVLKKLEAKYSLELKNLETGNAKIRFLLKPWSNTFNHFGYTTVIEKNNVQYLKFIKSLLLTLITIACAFVSLIYINFYLVIIFLTISFVSFFIAIGNNYDAFGNKFEEISSKLIFIDLFFKSDSTSRVYLIIFGMFLTGLIFHGISNWFE